MANGITDEYLTEIADNLGVDGNLPMLGLKLGLSKSKVDQYMRTNNKNNTSEGTSTMLFAWKKKTPKSQQIPNLVKALIASGLVEIAENKFPEEAGRQLPDGQEDFTAAYSASNVDISNQRKGGVTDVLLDELTTKIPHDKYTSFCNKLLPEEYTRVQTILANNGGNYHKAARECLGIWKIKTGGSESELAKALDGAELGGVRQRLLPSQQEGTQ